MSQIALPLDWPAGDTEQDYLDEDKEMAEIFSTWDPQSRISNLTEVPSPAFT